MSRVKYEAHLFRDPRPLRGLAARLARYARCFLHISTFVTYAAILCLVYAEGRLHVNKMSMLTVGLGRRPRGINLTCALKPALSQIFALNSWMRNKSVTLYQRWITCVTEKVSIDKITRIVGLKNMAGTTLWKHLIRLFFGNWRKAAKGHSTA